MGGKTKLAKWIVGNMPNHSAYVEPFGGSASVLLNKPRSEIEVYNDADGDVVNFFDVLRDRSDALVEFVRDVPFAEEIHNRWADEWFAGERPDDDVRRAGIWMFLRYSSFNGKSGTKSGFKREPIVEARTGQVADTWRQAPKRIHETAERLRGVSIVNDDFSSVIKRYDAPDTLFYVDPPYYGKEHYYTEEADHEVLAELLNDIEGDAMVSYTDIPPGLYEDWEEIGRTVNHNAGGNVKQADEKLLCNFRTEIRPSFVDQNQTTLTDSL
jgi:DNA adenine methylase